MEAAGTIGDLREVIDAAEQAPDRLGRSFGQELWWRGQAVATWSLQSGVHRQASLSQRERSLALEFRARAETRYDRCPDAADFPGWLFLMQHYRLPTRLLDWTGSVLAAAFFAVEEADHHDQPGALWGLNPMALNQEQIGSHAVPVSDDARISDMFEAAFFDPSIIGHRPATPAAVAAIGCKEIDIRMLVQLSGFTIHATSEPLDGLSTASKFLTMYEIPADKKRRLLHQLKLVGIRRSTLFPDLENLARELSAPPTL